MLRTSDVRLPAPEAENPLTLPSGFVAVHVNVEPGGVDVRIIDGEPPEQMDCDVIEYEIAGNVLTSAVNWVLVGLGHPAGLPASTASA